MNKNDYRIEKEKLYGVGNGYRYVLYNSNGKECCSLEAENEVWLDKFRYICNDIGKKVLYIYNFSTKSRYRNKGYGRILLKNIIRRYKGKYDLFHLNVCPYFEHHNKVEENVAPKNGLDKDKLVRFYESFGFVKYYIQHEKKNYIIMTMKGKSED